MIMNLNHKISNFLPNMYVSTFTLAESISMVMNLKLYTSECLHYI
jgi:hypothetical protein